MRSHAGMRSPAFTPPSAHNAQTRRPIFSRPVCLCRHSARGQDMTDPYSGSCHLQPGNRTNGREKQNCILHPGSNGTTVAPHPRMFLTKLPLAYMPPSTPLLRERRLCAASSVCLYCTRHPAAVLILTTTAPFAHCSRPLLRRETCLLCEDYQCNFVP